MSYNYLTETLTYINYLDQEFYNNLLEEFDLQNCDLETLLEADNNGTNESFIDKIINFFKSLFSGFFDKVNELTNKNIAWINENADKFKSISYYGLEAKCKPYWNITVEPLINQLHTCLMEINRTTSPKETDVDKIIKMPPYSTMKILNGADDKTYQENMKENLLINDTSEAVVLSGNALKDSCVNEMLNYCTKYKTVLLTKLKSAQKDIDTILNTAKRNIKANGGTAHNNTNNNNANTNDKQKNTNESYILFEDTNKTDQNKPDNKAAVIDKNGSDEKNEKNNEKQPHNATNDDYFTYIKSTCKINQIIVAAILTHCEKRYTDYMVILRDVIKARGNIPNNNNSNSDTNNNNDTSNKDNATNDNKQNNKANKSKKEDKQKRKRAIQNLKKIQRK